MSSKIAGSSYCRLLGALICASIVVVSSLAKSQSSNEIRIGPADYRQNVNNVPVTVSVTTYLKAVPVAGGIRVAARILADLVDLQRNIKPIVDSFNLPTDNCHSFSPTNPVVKISRQELAFREGAAHFTLAGDVTLWACAENPVPNSKVEYEMRDVGFGIKTKVPVVRTWPGDPIKTVVVTQPFDADLPVALVKSGDNTVSIQLSRPDIELKGQYAFITKGVLTIAGVDVSQKAYGALEKAIDPSKLRLAIPPELAKFHPIVTDAHFLDCGGHLLGEIDLSAEIPLAMVPDLFKVLLSTPKP